MMYIVVLSLGSVCEAYLDGGQRGGAGGVEVVALSQEDLPEGPLPQLPLQDDVPPLDVWHDCTHTHTRTRRYTHTHTHTHAHTHTHTLMIDVL